MSENQNRRIPEYAKYDAMTTEELEEILRLDLEAPEGQESDTEALLYVMEVLANRKRNTSHTGNTAQEAYESFKKNYMPEVEEKPEKEVKAKSTALRWLRSLTAAVIVIAIILFGSATAKAFGWDIWGTVVKWTEDTFHISIGEYHGIDTPGNDDVLPYSSLEEALRKGNVTDPLVPTYIPDGFQLTEIAVDDTPIQRVYRATYQCGERLLKITIRNYLNSAPEFVEQSEGLVETYEVAGIAYYLSSNYENTKAVWIRNSCECYISGEITIEELKMMIDSIEKG